MSTSKKRKKAIDVQHVNESMGTVPGSETIDEEKMIQAVEIVLDSTKTNPHDDPPQFYKLWDAGEHYTQLMDKLTVLKVNIISNLRQYISAQDYLFEAQDIMNTLETIAKLNRYTSPDWMSDVYKVNYDFNSLAEINDMLTKKQWPLGADSVPIRLSPKLESALWF